LFAGYRRYLFHGREEKIRRFFPAPLRGPLFRLLGNIYPQLDWAPRFLRARQTFRELGVDAAEGYFHNVMVVDDATRKRLFSDSLKREIGGYRASEVISEHMKNAPASDPVSIAQYVDLKTWLVGDILTKVDRTAMACGLEVRVPMLDPDFVGWTLGLPPEFKLGGGEGKIVLKQALQPLLPPQLLTRRKQGFSMPLAAWFRGPFGEGFARQISEGAGALEAYFDLGYAGRLLERHRQGLADNSRTLWLLWMFSGFLDRQEQYPSTRPVISVAG
jgi:asparagine synthase (glutamine-hydrolysing)